MSDEQRQVTLEEMVNGFAAARVALATVFPYLAHLLYAIKFVTSAPLSTTRYIAAIDRGWRVHFSPAGMQHLLELLNKKFGTLPVSFNEICAFTLLHEALHIFADHHARSVGKHPELWGIACDLEINPTVAEMLPAAGNALSTILFFPHQYSLPPHMPAEWYYEQFREKAQEMLSVVKFALDELLDFDKVIEDAGGSGATPTDVVRRAIVDDTLTDVMKRAILVEVANAIMQHNKSVGDVPLGLVRAANLILKPRVDWRILLRKFIQRRTLQERARVGDFTYRVPNKKTRWEQRTAILPSVVSNTPITLAIIIDTSGSMSEEELSQAVAETRAICRAGGYNIYIIVCDADVHRVERLWGKTVGHEQIKRLLIGGGGTILTTALLKAQDELKAKVAVVLTDGWSDWKDAERVKIPTIVACIGKDAAPRSSIPQHFEVVYTHKGGAYDGETE